MSDDKIPDDNEEDGDCFDEEMYWFYGKELLEQQLAQLQDQAAK